MTMTPTDREKIDLLMLAIAERRLRGQLDLTAPLSPAAMERISIEIDCPISRQKIARVITRALQKVRHHPSISAIHKTNSASSSASSAPPRFDSISNPQIP